MPDIERKFWDTGLIEKYRSGEIPCLPEFLKKITEVELFSGEARYLVERFFDLSNGRTSGGFGVAPLTWLDFDAYCRMRKTEFSNWEIGLIRMIDYKYCEMANKPKDK